MEGAVWRYSWQRFEALARKVIYKLQRLDASGIYGDYNYKTLWDEYCHEIQQGPHDSMLSNAWSATLRPILDEVIGSLSVEEKALLFFATDRADDFDHETERNAPIDDDALAEQLLTTLAEMAGRRSLERFG
jgi:hypothetical protein